jgi:hypothetical protein
MTSLFLLVKDLEEKLETRTNSFITNILLSFDYIKKYLEDQLYQVKAFIFVNINRNKLIRNIFYINILNT